MGSRKLYGAIGANYKEFVTEYSHNGKLYGSEVYARNLGEAQEILKSKSTTEKIVGIVSNDSDEITKPSLTDFQQKLELALLDICNNRESNGDEKLLTYLDFRNMFVDLGYLEPIYSNVISETEFEPTNDRFIKGLDDHKTEDTAKNGFVTMIEKEVLEELENVAEKLVMQGHYSKREEITPTSKTYTKVYNQDNVSELEEDY